MHFIPSRFLPVGLLMMAVGCGDSKSAATPGGSASLLEFCNSFLQAGSRVDARCLGGPEAYWSKSYPKAYCEVMSARVAAGLLVYDQSKAAACLSAVEGLDCSADRNAFPPACEPALKGTIAAGQACPLGSFPGCVPGSRAMPDSQHPCGGICQMVNSSCGEGGCVAGAQCVLETCVPDGREGQSCDGSSGPRCARNLRCVGAESGASGTCHAIENSGFCANYTDCGDGMYACAGPNDAKTCARWKFPGESCTPGQGECWLALYCGADGKCTDARATENQACGSDARGEFIRCASGLYCNGDSMGTMRTCVPYEAPGDWCSDGIECGYPNGDCDPSTHQCVTCN